MYDEKINVSIDQINIIIRLINAHLIGEDSLHWPTRFKELSLVRFLKVKREREK